MADNNDVPRIGKNKQTRNVDGVTVHLSYRPVTKDFEWWFLQRKEFRIGGVEKTIDKCIKAAKQYIQHLDPSSGDIL